MKKLIDTVLRCGYSTSTKTTEDYRKYLFLMKYILEDTHNGVKANNNPFWSRENEKNREELRYDIKRIDQRVGVKGHLFHILNRFANGDKYGIEMSE